MSDNKRNKRIQRIKRIILTAIGLLILVPICLCIILGIKIHGLNRKLQTLQGELEQANAQIASGASVVSMGGDNSQSSLLEEQGEDENELDSIRRWESLSSDSLPSTTAQGGIRKVYLTFDDGPSKYTNQILDILKEYDVKATFFVIAKGKEPYEAEYKRIIEEGHTLGMHSYSHIYRDVYRSKEAFIQDVNQLQDYLYTVTGTYPEFYRFPGGSSNRVSSVKMSELEDYLDEIGVVWYDWNISSGDATGYLGKQQIVRNCTANLGNYQEAVILLHDTAEKKSTVEALPEIIETILKMDDTVIVPITKDTIPIQHNK